MRIASMNPDNASNWGPKQKSIAKLERHNIDARIQETHDTTNKNMTIGNYDIYRSSNNKEEKGYNQSGVAL